MDLYDAAMRFETALDGTRLRIGHWPSAGGPDKRVVLCHGRTEFLEKYAETIGELNARGFDVWSMDWRGQGASDRALKNSHKGHIDRFESYLTDLTWFFDTIIGPSNGKTFLMAHSMGGHITLRAILEGRIKPHRCILSAPMIDLPMQGFSRHAIIGLCRLISGVGLGGRHFVGTGAYEPSRVKFDGNPLTGDQQRFEAIHAAIAANPVVTIGRPTFGWLDAAFQSLLVLHNLSQRSPSTCPILLFTAMADTVVSVTAQAAMSAALPNCEQVQIADARHEILHETDAIRQQFWDAFDRFTADG